MDKSLVKKVLQIIGLAGILVCGSIFFIVVVPLAAIIASEIWLPVSLFGVLLGLFAVITLILVVLMALWIKSPTKLRSMVRQSQVSLCIFVILYLVVTPIGTIFIYNAYQEPKTYKPLSDFDQSGWVHFNASYWELNNESIRSRIDFLWGDKPELVPLNPQLIYEKKLKGCTLIKMQIDVEDSGTPQWDVMLFFILVPDVPKATPCPVMIVHHQHAGRFEKGKEEPAGLMGDPRQALAVELVKRGYIVACHDALCFSERQEFSEKYTGLKMYMLNRTLNFKYVWDVSRLIDYLVTRTDVDASHIGIMGHSLGGQMAIWCAVYDSRIKVVLSSCGFGKIYGKNSMLEEGTFHNYAFYMPNMLKLNLKMEEVIGLLCNRPIFLSAGTTDYGLPIDGVAEIHNWLEEQYAYYDSSENIVTLRHVGGHMLPTATKEMMYTFLDSKL